MYAGKDGGSTSNVTSPETVASPQLPYNLKLVEQREATGSAPYCEKVVVGLDGMLEASNERVDLGLSDAQSASALGQDEVDTSCQCQWVVE